MVTAVTMASLLFCLFVCFLLVCFCPVELNVKFLWRKKKKKKEQTELKTSCSQTVCHMSVSLGKKKIKKNLQSQCQ